MDLQHLYSPRTQTVRNGSLQMQFLTISKSCSQSVLLNSVLPWFAKAGRQLCFTEVPWIPAYLAQKGPSSSELQKKVTVASLEQAVYTQH